MPKFLLQAMFTPEGTKGVLKEGGTARRSTVEQTVKALGGKLEAFYFAFGQTDVYLIVDLPDSASVAALSLAVNATGGVKLTTTPLMMPEEMDVASKKSVQYRAPGR
jgi:uncharacterized protein with GYD domain